MVSSFLQVKTHSTAWREKGTAVRNNDVTQLDTACSCLEAAELLLIPDPVLPGLRLQMGQIRSGLTAACWGEA